uniref:EGF-like domain-containing protein n=1 Tax=Steinernema glaseri TaxID=37863 RepID=A0A1I8APF9_9BILA
MKTTLAVLLLVGVVFCLATATHVEVDALVEGCVLKGVGLQGPVECDAEHPLCRVFNNGFFLCCNHDIPGTPHCN